MPFRAQIEAELYKDFVCSAFLISWFQLEESFALPDVRDVMVDFGRKPILTNLLLLLRNWRKHILPMK